MKACALFECTSDDLIGQKLSCFLKKTNQVLEEALSEGCLHTDGNVAVVSGKVVRMILQIKAQLFSFCTALGCLSNYYSVLLKSTDNITSLDHGIEMTPVFFSVKLDAVSQCGTEVPVSVWTQRQSQQGQHCLVMMERVERISAHVSFSQDVSYTDSKMLFRVAADILQNSSHF